MPFRAVFILLTVLSSCWLHAASDSSVYIFKRLAVADSEQAALAIQVDPDNPATLLTQNVPLLESADFKAILQPFLGQPISADLVKQLSAAISKYGQSNDRLVTQVLIPNQNVSDGTLRLAVVIGRFSQLAFSGNKWFSSKLLEERLGIKPGDEIRLSVLEAAVNWANSNPFRQVKVIVNPITDQPGKANLLIGVNERMPWRFAATADNYGNTLLGERRYTGSVQFGNLWGLDHQGSYQYVTTDKPKTYQVHAFNYRIPTPQRHFIEVSGAYSHVKPTFGINNVFTQTGISKIADIRYIMPLRGGTNPLEVSFGLDFKRSNNSLEYGGGIFTRGTEADTVQLTTGATYVRRDKRGAWVFVASLNLSPGNVTNLNDGDTYETTRQGSSPRYVYGSVTIQRQLTLSDGWEISSRLTGQMASTNLLGSEQLSVGGPTTVRGFSTNVQSGDQGFLSSTELQMPSFTTKLERISKKLPAMTTRFIMFYDVAQVFSKHSTAWYDPVTRPLASAGGGVRANVSNNFSLTFDYGWQITKQPYDLPKGSRGHIKASLAF